MAKIGRKRKLVLDFGGRDKLLHELKRLLDSRLGTKRPYMVVLTFASDGDEIVHAHEIINISDKTSLRVFRMTVSFFSAASEKLLRKYELTDDVPEFEGGKLAKEVK